ncbi:MAG: YD repeat-/RHS repeat-containing protein, partial [bacterium]
KAPILQVSSPSANDNFVAGQPVTIKWQTTVAAQSYAIASHTLELSTDSGATFTQIKGAEDLPATTQEFTWTAPNIEVMDKAQIRVSTVDLGARRANSTTGNFSIIKTAPGDTQAPTVTFLLPKGAERFTSGDNLQISWMSGDNVAVTSQDLSLSTDGGASFPITIASGLPGATQSFSFPIPMTLQSDQARLRLVVKDGAGNSSQAVTPSNFRIEQAADTLAPTVRILQPTSSESLIAGQPIQVNWQSVDNRAVVSQALLLSLDGGKTFATVASFGASDNSFLIRNIEELNITNSQGIVRITATDSSGNIGQASTQFSTSPAITNAIYQSKILTISGIGFMSNSASRTTRLFVNEREITLTPMTVSNTSFTIKGSKKKLGGIVRGNNTVRLVINGIESNSLTFNF